MHMLIEKSFLSNYTVSSLISPGKKAKGKEKEQTPFMLRNSVGLIQLALLLTSTF